MAAAALLSLTPNPNPNPTPYLTRSHLPHHGLSQSLALPIRPLARSRLAARLLPVDRRFSHLVTLAAQNEESNKLDVELEKEKDESHELWKEMLETFKEEALKIKGMSQGSYEVYSEKATVMLLETSKKLKIQAEKARHDLSVIAKEISEEGKVYLASAAKNSPDELKDIVETFASADGLNQISAVRDFYVGIPYGAFLAFWGFLSFMLTGSIPAIRFGIVLGSALLGLSVLSLRSWKSGKHSPLLLKGQAGIAAVLFIREWRLFSRWGSFTTFLSTLISGVVLAFYIYRMMVDGRDKGSTPEQASE